MASKLRKNLQDNYVLARQAVWAGDRVHALKYLAEAAAITSAGVPRRGNQYVSLEEIIAANVARMRRELEQLEKRSQHDGDLANVAATGPPAVSSEILRGMVYGDGFGHFYMRAYLTRLDLEEEFREAVFAAADVATPKPAVHEIEVEKQDNDFGPLINVSRSWIAKTTNRRVHVHVGEFPLIEANCHWYRPPKSAKEVRGLFKAVLRSIDPAEKRQER